MGVWSYGGKMTAWNGISQYLALNYNCSSAEKINKTIKEFLLAHKLPFDKRNNGYAEHKNAQQVQQNWALFVKYLKDQNTKPK